MKNARHVRNHSNTEEESLVNKVRFASFFSEFVVSPTIIANVEFYTSQSLNLCYKKCFKTLDTEKDQKNERKSKGVAFVFKFKLT